jgi:hypothetical protein
MVRDPLAGHCLLHFHFYVAAIIVVGMKTHKSKMIFVGSLYILAIAANIICMGFLGWQY